MASNWLTPLTAAALAATIAACGEAQPTDPGATPAAPATMATTNATISPAPGSSPAGARPSPTASETAVPEGKRTPIPADAAPTACGADKAARFVGRTDTPTLRAEVIETVGHNRIRWIGPGDAVTMDFSEGRLNMALDTVRKITAARCG